MHEKIKSKPRVSIGLPVYNGSNYLSFAIETILAQTYEDFELIISDNASTDSTEQICRDFASKDSRIIYIRREKNLGAAMNFNSTVQAARGEYFKWSAHDDIVEPTFIEKCVEILDNDPLVGVVSSQVLVIDENQEVKRTYVSPLSNTCSTRPEKRFYQFSLIDHACFEVFGLMRKELLERTAMIGAYVGSDRILLSELSLLGKIFEISEPLFLRREHGDNSINIPRHKRLAWFDTSKKRKISFQYWRELSEYLKAIHRANPSVRVRIACWRHMSWWVLKHWRALGSDLKFALKQSFSRS